MNKDDRIYIDHILQRIDQILKYISGKNQDTFREDQLTQDAVVRNLEIIGEATKRNSVEMRSKNPNVPWTEMAGMRDILIHDYIDVDVDIVWRTASESINELKILLEKLEY